MTIGAAFNNALSGLNAGQAGLAIISQNISNANTDGYSRKVVNQSANVIAGSLNGVTIEAATRLANNFLYGELKNATSDYNTVAAKDEFYQLTQNLFGEPGSDTSVANLLSDFFGTIDALANNPENAGLRFDVVSAAVTLSDTVLTMADRIQSLRATADQEISSSVNRVNTLLQEVQELNIQINQGTNRGDPIGDLEDKRDLAAEKIAAEIDVNITRNSDGTISLFTKSGVPLVETEAKKIVYSQAATVTSSTVFGDIRVFSIDANGATTGTGTQIVTSGTSSAVTTNLRSGRIFGLLQARDSDLADLSDALDALANRVRDEVNAVHNTGVGFPAPNSLTGTRTVTGADAFTGTGTVRIAVTDSTGTIVDVTDLDLTALGATDVNGVMAAINGALVGNATANIVNGNLVISADNSANGIAINDAGTAESVTSRTFSHYFGLNDLFTGTGAIDMAVRSDIVSDSSRISTGLLSTTAAISEVGITVGDNRVAQSLAAVGDANFTFSTVGGIPASNVRLGDFAASMIGLNAARAADSAELTSERELVLENLDNRHTSDTGVNLDEELATMVLFQNAFTVSARVLDIASEMLETLVRLGQ